MSSFYRNWHSPNYWDKAKKKPLSDIDFPVVFRKADATTALTFKDDKGKQITFILDHEQTKYLVNQLIQIKHI